jgi:hypothetical protein
MSAGKISYRWHRPDRFLGASQMKVHYRLNRSEVECCELHSLQRGHRARCPQAQVAALLAGRQELPARKCIRPSPQQWRYQRSPKAATLSPDAD